MAYNPSALTLSVDSIAGGSLRIHFYVTSDSQATVAGTGYFTGAADRGLRVGDMLVCKCSDGTFLAELSAISGGGAGTIVFETYDVVPLTNGGTGATSASAARTALGLTSYFDAFPTTEKLVVNAKDVIYVPSNADIGKQSLYIGDGGQASTWTTGLEGRYQTSVGFRCLTGTTTGSYNTGMGFEVMERVTTGYRNTGFGEAALIYLVTGYGNTAVGHKAIQGENTQAGTWFYNTGVGFNALLDIRDGANHNVGVGITTMSNSGVSAGLTGSYNNAFGDNCMLNLESGINNNAHGYNTLPNLSSGGSNIGFGHNTGGGITTGTGNVIIGGALNSLSSTLTQNIIIGTGSGIPRIWASATSTQFTGGTTAAPVTYFEVISNVSTPVNWTVMRPSATGTDLLISPAASPNVGVDAAVNIMLQATTVSTRRDALRITGLTSADCTLSVIGGITASRAPSIFNSAGGTMVGGVGTNAALATNATLGHLLIPGCAGTPTGVPVGAGAAAVGLIYDTTNNILYAYDGGWNAV